MEFNADIGQPVVTACLERGLLINRVKPNAIRFVPPLIIDNKEVDRALGILGKVLDNLVK
jgi:4-aminobutyrate aminotransferase-like enzyme